MAHDREPAPGARHPGGAAASATADSRERAFVTPDAVGLDLELATLGSRGVAYLLDLTLFVLVLIVLSLAQSALFGAFDAAGSIGVAVVLVLAFAWQFGYPIGFETLWRGRTLGKAAMGLRVVTVEGAPVGVRHATVRAVVGLLELVPTVGLPAIVTSFATRRAQRLGDLAAGTLVIRERRAARSPQVEHFTAPPGYEQYAASLDVSAISASDYAVIRDALRRSRELPPATARSVLSDVLAGVGDRVRPLPPAGADPHVVLQCVAAAVQARRVPAAGPAGPRTGATPGGGQAPPTAASHPPPPPSGPTAPPAGPQQPQPGAGGAQPPPADPDQGFRPPA